MITNERFDIAHYFYVSLVGGTGHLRDGVGGNIVFFPSGSWLGMEDKWDGQETLQTAISVVCDFISLRGIP